MTLKKHLPDQRVEKLHIIENRKINDFYYVLKLQSDQNLPKIVAGSFVNVLIEDSQSTFLRRPISIYDYNNEDRTLDLLIQIVGNGTETLSHRKVGDLVDIIYPLGKGFTAERDKKNILLIGGGVGLAPLHLWGKELASKGYEVTTLIGGRGKDNILDIDKFESFGQLFISTEDGSLGEKGLLTYNSIMKRVADFSKIYTCGPDPMMKAVARIAHEHNIPCEASLENLMACGIGSCLCCVEDTKSGHKCVCTEGPVFNINDLKWV